MKELEGEGVDFLNIQSDVPFMCNYVRVKISAKVSVLFLVAVNSQKFHLYAHHFHKCLIIKI